MFRRYAFRIVFVAALLFGRAAAQNPTTQSALASATQPAGAAASQPQTAPADTGLHADELISLLVGANAPAARQTGARELLRSGSAEAVARVALAVQAGDAQVRLAVARVLAESPELFRSELLDALLAALGDADRQVRSAAAEALGAVASDEVVARLSKLATDANQTDDLRAGAIEGLAATMRRDALAVLANLLDDVSAAVRSAALAGLERAAATNFRGDAASARRWWERSQTLSADQWRQAQLRRLAARDWRARQQIADLERRLTAALREAYVRSAEDSRPALLASYLEDAAAATRLLGLELTQARIAEGREIDEPLRQRVRSLLRAVEPEVRAAAVQTTAALRDPSDERRFLDLLAGESESLVRRALLNGLGYVGNDSAADALLSWATSDDAGAADEAITALGRLAARGVLSNENRARVAEMLLAIYERTDPTAAATRERLLGALAPLADARAGAVFVSALTPEEPIAVRLAAIRGIGLLLASATRGQGDGASPAASRANLLAALIPPSTDPDAGVRRACVDLLAQYGEGDDVLEALWARLASDAEADENIRNSAWKGAARILASQPADQILAWAERLPVNGAVQRRRTLELLLMAERKLADANPPDAATLGRTRVRIATLQLASDKLNDALATYQRAVRDLHAAKSPALLDAAAELTRISLLSGRFDDALAKLLADCRPALDTDALWKQLRPAIEERLKPQALAQAQDMLARLTKIGGVWSEPTAAEIQNHAQRAAELHRQAVAEDVNAALVELRADPQNAAARERIVAHGREAAPALRAALESTLSAEPADAEAERRIHDLLKQVLPDWPGFAADAPLEAKRQALAAIPA